MCLVGTASMHEMIGLLREFWTCTSLKLRRLLLEVNEADLDHFMIYIITSVLPSKTKVLNYRSRNGFYCGEEHGYRHHIYPNVCEVENKMNSFSEDLFLK